MSEAVMTESTPAIKSRWFWYCAFCVACWGPYIIFSKMGSMTIPPMAMQFLFTIGGVPIALGVLVARRFRLERSSKGIFNGVLVGVLSGIGGTALFAAYATGANTAVVTVVSGLYPLVTVILAVLFLRERLTKRQWLGLAFATAAFVLFSF